MNTPVQAFLRAIDTRQIPAHFGELNNRLERIGLTRFSAAYLHVDGRTSRFDTRQMGEGYATLHIYFDVFNLCEYIQIIYVHNGWAIEITELSSVPNQSELEQEPEPEPEPNY
jgi:hypothetical protein